MSGLTPDAYSAIARTALLLGPLGIAVGLVLLVKPTPREATAAMVAFLWQLPALLLLQLLVTAFGWWRFAPAPDQLLGLPISLWIGWALWWGVVPALALRVMPMLAIVVVAAAADIASMPLLAPMVTLSNHWLVGELAALIVCLLPGIFAAVLTRNDSRPELRAMLHVLGWGGYLVLVIPAAVLAYEGRSYSDLLRLPHTVTDWLIAASALFLLFVGIAATMEFAVAGRGTPIPFDPPKRVVTTGPYAFIANPMQIISAAVMFLLAGYAASWGLFIVAAMFLTFDAIYAHWYNTAHIARVKPEWQEFSAAVPLWRSRWRPFVTGKAEVRISPDGPARWVWDRLWLRGCPDLGEQIELRTRTPGDGTRLIYRRTNAGVNDTGIIAAARVLEHGPLPLAIVGWVLRFPLIDVIAQVVSGLAVRWWRRDDVAAGK